MNPKKPGTVFGAPAPKSTRKFLVKSLVSGESLEKTPIQSTKTSEPTQVSMKPHNFLGASVIRAAKAAAKKILSRFGTVGDYSPNNELIYDYAYAGFLGGVYNGKDVSAVQTSDRGGIINQALIFAQAVDSLIETGDVSFGQAGLIGSLSQNIMANKYSVNLPESAFHAIAEFIAKAYTQAAPNFTEPVNPPGGGGPVQTDGGSPLTIDLNTLGAVTAADTNGSVVLAYSINNNSSGGDYQTFLGGEDNQIGNGAANATLIGGQNNFVGQSGDTCVGGINNSANGGNGSCTYGGIGNDALGTASACIGGGANETQGNCSACIGGSNNVTAADYVTILAGQSCQSLSESTVVFGTESIASHSGCLTSANGQFVDPADAQRVSHFVLRNFTPGMAAGESVTLLTGPGTAFENFFLEQKSYLVHVQATANDGNLAVAGWDYTFLCHSADGEIAVLDELPAGFTGAATYSAAGGTGGTWTLVPTVNGSDATVSMIFTDGVDEVVAYCVCTLDWTEVGF